MMSILLVKRDDYPFKDKWCLPGGFLNPVNETLEECAKRVLKDETNVSDIYLEQLFTFDGINRDPRLRVISCAHVALIDKNKLTGKLAENASWFDVVNYDEGEEVVTMELFNGVETIKFSVNKLLRDKTVDRYQYTIKENNRLAFDNPLVIVTGIQRIRNKTNYTDIVFNMMPEYFTLGELQQVYEVILGKKLLDPAFRRIIASKVEQTDKTRVDGGHRPSKLFKYKKNK